MRKWLFVIGSVAVSGLLLWLTLRDVPLDEVWITIQRSNTFWILVSFLTVGGALFTRGVRWNVMLGGRIGTRTGFYIFSVTMLLNQLPLRAGEVVRVLLATRYEVPVMTAAASVVVERLIDVVIVVLMIAIGLTQIPDVPEGVARTAAVFGGAAVVAFAVLIGFALRPTLGHRLALWLERVLPFLRRFRLQHQVDAVLIGLRPLTNLRTFALTVLWTVIAWGFSLATFMALA
ncbi:MAG TPA: lysylphosphatidylglycerol synthase transmembrane domain-containing protein, partial [Candidatus Limnocylindrales bacterium]|nr:lysylphosphatidylglycerol synthase transmembrane domain-containing protein [Candidatus Limnocylindrales bacterium]